MIKNYPVLTVLAKKHSHFSLFHVYILCLLKVIWTTDISYPSRNFASPQLSVAGAHNTVESIGCLLYLLNVHGFCKTFACQFFCCSFIPRKKGGDGNWGEGN